MLNFDILMNLSQTQSNNKLASLNKQSQNSNFKDIFSNQNLNTNEGNKSLKNENIENSKEIIKIESKDIDKKIDNIVDFLGEDLEEEQVEDIINIYIFLNVIESNKFKTIINENFDFIEKIEFIKENEDVFNGIKYSSLNMDDLNIKDYITINNDSIEIPLNMVEKLEDNIEIPLKGMDLDLNKESLINEILKQVVLVKDFEKKENCNDILNNVKNLIYKYENDKIDDLNLKVDFENIDNIEEVVSLDYINKNSFNNDIKNNSSFNNCLLNQRVIEMNRNNFISENNLEKLIKLSESKNEVTNIVSQYSYGLNKNISDIINENIKPETVRYSYFESDLAKTISHMKTSNLEELTLKVRPKELGEITINLLKKDGISEILITIEKEELFNSLKKDISLIEVEIKKTGLNIDNISIEIKKNENTSFNLDNPYKDDNLNNSDTYNKKKKESKNSNKRIDSFENINREDTSNINLNENLNVSDEINILA